MLRKAGSLFPNNTLFGSKGVNLDEIIKGRMKLLVNVCPTELYQSAKLSRESFLEFGQSVEPTASMVSTFTSSEYLRMLSSMSGFP